MSTGKRNRGGGVAADGSAQTAVFARGLAPILLLRVNIFAIPIYFSNLEVLPEEV